MKPSAFDYRCPDSLDEALALLARYGDDAKIIAGGQSLMPMMNFRVVRPAMVIDIGRLLELDKVETNVDCDLSIGALTRHRTLESSEVVRQCFPIIPDAMTHVAHLAIRNRGTIGGSLTHADPAAELPMLVRLLDGKITVKSLRGVRQIAAADFFLSPLTTALSSDEILVRVDLPGLPTHQSAFEEFSRRSGDFAIAAVGVVLILKEGCISGARVGLMGVGETPLRSADVEDVLVGTAGDENAIKQALIALRDTLKPRHDQTASSDFRLHLSCVLLERAVRRAVSQGLGFHGKTAL